MFFSRQTLYLLILIFFFVVILLAPVAIIMTIDTGKETTISVHHFFTTQVLSLLLVVFAIIALCLFKKKALQSRITIFIMIVCIALQILFPILLQLYTTDKMMVRYELSFIIPLMSALLAYVTFRRITKAEIMEKILEFKQFDQPKNNNRNGGSWR